MCTFGGGVGISLTHNTLEAALTDTGIPELFILGYWSFLRSRHLVVGTRPMRILEWGYRYSRKPGYRARKII